jgi:hypothetical protein
MDRADAPGVGADFIAYGFPEDHPHPESVQRVPTARLFKGHVQRSMQYMRGPYSYFASEVSIPMRTGLSGGPLFPVRDRNRVIGLACENVQSTTYVGRSAVIERDGVIERVTERDVVQYGIALLLHPIADWLDAEVPPQTPRLP